MTRQRGKFIVLEGISGSGKSTQAKELAKLLPNAVLNAEPTRDLFGAIIRAVYMREPVPAEAVEKALRYGEVSDVESEGAQFWLLAHHVANQAKHKLKLGEVEMQILFMADRVYDLLTKILPWLREGKIVVQDRYLPSSLSYGHSGSLSMENLMNWQKKAFASYGISADDWRPDLLVIFDLDPGIAMERLKNSGKKIDLFEESLARLEKIRGSYLLLAKRADLAQRIAVVNADKSPEDITKELLSLTQELTAV